MSSMDLNYPSTCNLTNVTLANNNSPTGPSILLGHAASSANIINSIISNDIDGLASTPNPLPVTINYSNTYNGIINFNLGSGNINSDPLFLDPSNDNFNLQHISPCIDSGNPNPNYNDPNGSRNDMGAYPYDPCLNNSTSSLINVAACDDYTWDGVVYTQSGSYTNVYTNVNGCDSVHVLSLTINQSSSGSSNVTACDDYTWDGVVYSQSGSYTNVYTNVNGCDSVHVLSLTINYSYVNDTTIYLCKGDSILFNNVWYFDSNNFVDTFSSVNNCDSIIRTNLLVSELLYCEINNINDSLRVIGLGGTSPYSFTGVMGIQIN